MRRPMFFRHTVWGFILVMACTLVHGAQSAGTLRGKVVLRPGDKPIHGVTVLLKPGDLMAVTDEAGVYEFHEVPSGRYTLIAHLERLPDVVKTVEIAAGTVTTLDLEFALAPIREQITVTASGREETLAEAFHTVISLDATDLLTKNPVALGEALEYQPGVAKRSFGPGSSRPVIRGFDGDRVLVLQDGIRTGSLSSQSGEHGEPLDLLNVDTVEVVKGPATLLYGSNALGGVVNAISRHHQMHPHAHQGWRGYATGLGGSANGQGGASAGLEYGRGKWLVWGTGSGHRTGDYETPVGRVPNSKTRGGNGTAGLGHYGERGFFSLSYGYDRRRYGVPFAGQFEHGEEPDPEHADDIPRVDLTMRRHNVRVSGGVRELGRFERLLFSVDYTSYRHQELKDATPETLFRNRHLISHLTLDHRSGRGLSGSLGLWVMRRTYETQGQEALAPPVRHWAVAFFGLHQWDWRRLVLQVGGRLESNRYDPRVADPTEELPSRSFTGFSGALGLRFPLWEGGTFVINYTHSFRAPALEELYNRGPHVGNLAFEIGNPALRRERGDGVDLSLRHRSDRWRAEANAYYYRLDDFIFPALTGEVRDGLREVVFQQGDSRFVGTEVGFDLALHRAIWLSLGMDAVDAELRPSGTPLPRIPPVRGRAAVEIHARGLTLAPEVLMARAQNDLFPTETRTPGYAVFNLRMTYTRAQAHVLHIISLTGFNLGNRLYRNHLSFIKDLAPEIGRGVRLAYTIRFF